MSSKLSRFSVSFRFGLGKPSSLWFRPASGFIIRRHRIFSGRTFAACVVCLLTAGSIEAPTQQLQSRTDSLRYSTRLITLVRAGGAIFSGTVTSVQRIAAQRSGEVETVRVSFRVEHAVRGTQVGQHLTIREWSGLWDSGERYRVGERVLLFLYPPSRLGLTSPVGGPAGRFAIDKNGQVTISNLPGVTNPQGPQQLSFSSEITPSSRRVSMPYLTRVIRRMQEK